jgi:outer membrane protein insertion porin family
MVCALLLMLAYSPLAYTQEPATFIVEDIRIEGLQRISEGAVFNYLPVSIGDELDRQRIQEAMRAMFATEFFANVELRRDGNTLIISVVERPTIANFEITGNKDIKTEDLMESLSLIGLKRGRILNQSVLDDVERSLTDEYFSQGKYAAVVKAEVQELPDNQVEININIKEGDRARIRQINIVGNTIYDDEDLLEIFQLRTPHWLSFIRQDDRYSREALQGDLESLRSYYMDRGYADFGLDSTQVAISPDKKDIFITINIVEGDLYKISDVKLAGELIVPESALAPYVQVRPGQIFSQRLLTNTEELIQLRLGEEGYAFTDVEPVTELDKETHEVEVTFYVDPKNRVYVRRINFNGADAVNDEVFRREMRQFEGGYLSKNKVDRSRVRLQRLPYIESVEVKNNPVPGTSDLVDVDFNITEGLPGQFGGGLGYSDSQGVLFNANFVHTNFMGTGNRVAAEIQSGRYSKVYSLGFTDPYRTIDGLSRQLSVGYRDITQFTSASSDFSTETISAGATWSYPITEYQRLTFGLSWQRAQLFANDFSSQQAQDWVLNNGATFQETVNPTLTLFGTEFDTVELVVGWSRDSFNRAFFANRGSRLRATMNIAVPGSDVEYYVASIDYRKYIPLWGRWTLSLNAEAAFGDDIGSTTSLPPYRNFFGGGPGSVRGFRESRLGPKDSFGNPYGGNAKFVSQIELIIPLPEKWSRSARFAAFYDIGNIFSTGGVRFFDRLGDPLSYDVDYDNLKSSVGIAAEWLAPLGLFRFSYAFPLNDDAATDRFFGDEVERFQFTIGNAF